MAVNVTFGSIFGNFGNMDTIEAVRSEDVTVSTVSQQTSVRAPDTLSPNERWAFIATATTDAVYVAAGTSAVATDGNTNNISRYIPAGGSISGALKAGEGLAVIRAS